MGNANTRLLMDSETGQGSPLKCGRSLSEGKKYLLVLMLFSRRKALTFSSISSLSNTTG